MEFILALLLKFEYTQYGNFENGVAQICICCTVKYGDVV